MQTHRLASFSLWALTAFMLVSIFLKYEPSVQQALPPVSGQNTETSFNTQNIAYLFLADTPLAADTSPVKGSLNLKGIAYTTNLGQSRALIQTSNGKVEAFREGQRLPNGSLLLKIERRAVVYEENGNRRSERLPQNR